MRPATFGDVIWTIGMVGVFTSHYLIVIGCWALYAMFGVWLNYKFPVK